MADLMKLEAQTKPFVIVAYCEHCGTPLTMQTWWKIWGKNLCPTHGKKYDEYMRS